MSSQVANFASGIGVYDGTLTGTTNPVLDISANVGTGDLSLNATQAQYMSSVTAFTTATATSGNGISFSGWFYPSGAQTLYSTIFDISGSGVNVALYYGAVNGTTGNLYGYFNGVDVSSAVNITANNWHFYCYTIYCTSQTTAYQSLYVDNSLNTATANTATYTTINAGPAVGGSFAYIGNGKGSLGGRTFTYFNGKIDDFRFYNRVLSPPEINVLYSFNYKSGAIPAITSQMNYDISYVNAVQIDVSGIFSGLYVTRTAQVGGVVSTVSTTVSCANLVFVNASTWAYVDSTVASDTSYSYTVQPYVMNTSGTLVQFGTVTTTPLYNGFFNQGTSLPIANNCAAATSASVPGWSFTPGTTISLCNGSVNNVYTGALPSTVTYYIDISQNVAQSTTMSQYCGIYQGTTGTVSFYAWPKDNSYNTTESLSVTLGGISLLNNYTFSAPQLTGNPYTAFNLPFTMAVAGTYLLTITVTNTAANLSGINFGGVQIRSSGTAGVGYKWIDPSNLALYYPFDTATVSGTVVYDCSAGFSGLASSADASLCGGAVMDTANSLMGTADVSLNGTSSYVQLGAWTMPPATTGNGFSISGWFYPSTTAEPSNATICSLASTACRVMVYLNQQTNKLDFSMNVAGGSEYVSNAFNIQTKGWNFFSMTALWNGTTGVYTYYLNDVSMATQTGAWPSTVAQYTTNFLGGVPAVSNYAVNAAGQMGFFQGYMEDFRVYNRALSERDVFALWSYGFAKNSYANLIDTSGLGMYYPMDQGSGLISAPPQAFGTFTASAIGYTGFTLSWTGGVGTGVSYSYSVNGGTYTTVAGPSSMTVTGLTQPTSGTSPTPYAWYVDISASNLGGTVHGTTTVYTIPTALVLSSSYSSSTNLITLSWTGGLGYNVAYTYTFTSASSGYTGAGTATTGTIASGGTLAVTNGAGPWTIDVSARNVAGTVDALTSVAATPFTITSNITNWQSATDVSGTSTTNGITYKVYTFKSTGISYALTYTCNVSSYIYVLAVGGGGSGGNASGGGGGGSGGVVMMPILLPATTNTISVFVGAGGAGSVNTGNNGTATTVTFPANTSSNISANGGGGGGRDSVNGLTGGSTGGNGYNATISQISVPPTTSSFNYANYGGGTITTVGGGGGGGAGSVGLITTITNSGNGGNGGSGIQCFLPGIKDFTPSGTSYGTYYWGGGGGGGSASSGLSGNGGVGGGGGGSQFTATPATNSIGGSGINAGGNGAYNNGLPGSGGINTGGGGGGGYGATTGGAGGSGIVVIAFPQIPITSNISAVLPSTLVSSGAYNAVLNNASLTASATNSIKEAFACKLINYNYFGPIMTLRYSTDTTGLYTTNFYADVCGNMGTGYMGTGTSVSAWLTANGANTTYAYVTKWYNQGMDVSFNSATQYTVGSQPIYDVAYGNINFGLTSGVGGVIAPQNGWFNLPIGSMPGISPSTTVDTSYTFVTRHGNTNSSSIMTLYSSGINGSMNANSLVLNTPASGQYYVWWAGNDLASTTSAMANNSVITSSYLSNGNTTPGTRYLYVNGNQNNSNVPTLIHKQDPGTNYIGNCQASVYAAAFQFQMMNLFSFTSSLSNSDRLLIEATPYTYATPATITGVTASAVTATTFVLSWTQVSGASYHVLWINGSVYASYGNVTTTGTVTPGVSGPWNVNLYAYNSSNVLLASYASSNGGIFYQMLPFTTINSTSTPNVIFTGLLKTTYGLGGSVSVNQQQTKMMVASTLGLWYTTSSDNGITWNALTLLTSQSGYSSVQLSADGTKGVTYVNSYPYYFIWTGATPVLTQLNSTQNTNYWNTSLTPNGQYALFSGVGIAHYYAYWNGTAYVWGGQLGTYSSHVGIAISPDGNMYMYEGGYGHYYNTISWSNNVPTVGTATSSGTCDARGFVFLGGGYSGTSTYMLGFFQGNGGSYTSGSGIYYANFNQGTRTESNVIFNTTVTKTGLNIGDSIFAFTPCGAYGNTLYCFENWANGTSIEIIKFTLSVT